MDPVSTYQDVAARGVDMRASTIEEIRRDAAFVLRERTEPATSVDRLRPEPLLDGAMNDALKATAVDRKLRHVVAGIDSAGFAPDLLAVAVEVIELVGADCDVVELLQQAETCELTHCVRQRVDANAKLADGIGLLENLGTDAA